MNPINRRTFLRGVGTAMALPLLDAMLPLNALAQSAAKAVKPMRMAFMFVPNGISMEHWTPASEGAGYALPSVLDPIKDLKDDFSILTGLSQDNAFALGDGPGDHARSTACWLTGVHPKKTSGADIKSGISVDQVAAKAVGGLTPFASLEIGCERGAMAGDCDSGYSCAYSSNIAWRSESTPVAKEVNPRLVFERLFGSGDKAGQEQSRARRDLFTQSILDIVMEDATRLKSRLGKRDQGKLDEYFESVRDIEKRIIKLEQVGRDMALAQASRPTGIPHDYGEHIRLMGDMMVLAFQADLTRICTFMFANDGSNRRYPMIGVPEGHHDTSHDGKDPAKLEKKRLIDQYHIDQLGYVLRKLKSIKETDGTMLDNTMVVYGAGISDGDRHNHDNLPILFAGKAGGAFKTGRHVVYKNHTPLNNLYLSMLDRMGVRIESLGNSTGKLAQLW
ncbi:MAG: DUF1552 domain-containing protein [Armatimonadetes bacterium]|nr:DUF1552 domain-containing protein [Armatimonadota bacterium]